MTFLVLSWIALTFFVCHNAYHTQPCYLNLLNPFVDCNRSTPPFDFRHVSVIELGQHDAKQDVFQMSVKRFNSSGLRLSSRLTTTSHQQSETIPIAPVSQ